MLILKKIVLFLFCDKNNTFLSSFIRSVSANNANNREADGGNRKMIQNAKTRKA